MITVFSVIAIYDQSSNQRIVARADQAPGRDIHQAPRSRHEIGIEWLQIVDFREPQTNATSDAPHLDRVAPVRQIGDQRGLRIG